MSPFSELLLNNQVRPYRRARATLGRLQPHEHGPVHGQVRIESKGPPAKPAWAYYSIPIETFVEAGSSPPRPEKTTLAVLAAGSAIVRKAMLPALPTTTPAAWRPPVALCPIIRQRRNGQRHLPTDRGNVSASGAHRDGPNGIGGDYFLGARGTLSFLWILTRGLRGKSFSDSFISRPRSSSFSASSAVTREDWSCCASESIF